MNRLGEYRQRRLCMGAAVAGQRINQRGIQLRLRAGFQKAVSERIEALARVGHACNMAQITRKPLGPVARQFIFI